MKTKLIIVFFTLITSLVNAQWQYLGLANGLGVRCLATDGTNIFAGALTGMYSMPINGGSWTTLNTGLANTRILSCLINSSNFFAGNFGPCVNPCGVNLSTNNGISWAAINNGLTDTIVLDMAMHGSNFFAGTYGGGVFLSTNNGNNWTAVNNGLTNYEILSLAINGTNIFAGTNGGGIFLSTNNGSNWTAVNNGLTDSTILTLAVNGTDIFAGTEYGGAFLSTNNGSTWAAINTGLVHQFVASFAFSGSNIFAASAGVFLSTNNGSSWTGVSTGLTDPNVWNLAIMGTNIVAACESGVWIQPLSIITGIEEDKTAISLSIYPNPFTSLLTVEGTKEEGEIIIFDVTMKELFREKTSEGSTKINTEFLDAGFYMLRCSNRPVAINFKLVKN